MFKALKEKLKETLQKISARAEKEAIEEEDTFLKEAPVTESMHEKRTAPSSEPLAEGHEKPQPSAQAAEVHTSSQPVEEKHEEKKGFLSKLFSRKKKEETLEESPSDQAIPDLEEEANKTLRNMDSLQSTEYFLGEDFPEKKLAAVIPEYKKKALVDSIREEKKRQQEEKIRERSVVFEHVLEEQRPTVVEPPPVPSAEEKKKGFFSFLKEKVITKRLTTEQFDGLFWDLELVLLEHNVAVDVVERIKQELHRSLVDVPLRRGKINETILAELHRVLSLLFDAPALDLVEAVKESGRAPV